MSDIKGYVAGSGATFTPSKKASWTEEFNDLLVTSGLSRNALTDLLIEIGLSHHQKANRAEKLESNSIFNNAQFSPSERELLNTNAYQQIIREFAKSLLSNSRAAMETTFQQSAPPVFNPTYPSQARVMYTAPAPVEKEHITPLSSGARNVEINSSNDKENDSELPKNKKEAIQPPANTVTEATTEVIEGFEVADLAEEMAFLHNIKK